MGLAIRKLANWEEEKAEWQERKAKATKKKRFSLKKLLQKPKKKKDEVKDLSDLPNLRNKDTHPDAPARQPIFADKDLGSPLESKIKPFDQQEASEENNSAVTDDPAVAPAPFVMDKSLRPPEPTHHEQEVAIDISGQIASHPAVEEEVSSVEAKAPDVPAELEANPAPAPFAAPDQPAQEETAKMPVEEISEDLSALSIGELTDRLEAGLARLKQLQQNTAVAASVPAAAAQPQEAPTGGISVSSSQPEASAPPQLKPVEPTQEDLETKRQAEMDAALKAALGTLEKMTAQR